MQESLLATLRSRRARIRSHWATLLKTEPVLTPLANPDALVHLIDWTLDEIFRVLGHAAEGSGGGEACCTGAEASSCACGRNPLLAYFAAGGQAVREGLILAQAASAPLDPRERDASLEELNLVLRQISRRELESFCGLCQFRTASAGVPAAAGGPMEQLYPRASHGR